MTFYSKYSHATMIRHDVYDTNLELMWAAIQSTEGAMVECGTWRGGMSAAMIELGGPDRDYLFCDSFDGLPPPEVIDGLDAKRWSEDRGSPTYFDNCRATLDEFKATLSLTGNDMSRVTICPGFFHKTFPELQPPSRIAVLRIDVDWYDPTERCLFKFWPHVAPGGLVLLDDYGVWEGCTKAVHRFLSDNELPCPIRQQGYVTYIVKGETP